MYKIEKIGVSGKSCGFFDSIYVDGKTAAEKVKELKKTICNEAGILNFRIIKIDDDESDSSSWRDREKLRFEFGIYRPVPWIEEQWYIDSKYSNIHFPHISLNNPGKIAFTESDNKGLQDKQIRIRAGKYLKKYFSDILPNVEIQYYASQIRVITGDYNVKIAMTPDDIVDVYSRGPRSCMRGEDYVRVYGAGDLGVAYMESPDDSDAISCRAIVWPERKIYGRVYGDDSGFQSQFVSDLESMGFEKSGDFSGARLLRIPYDDSFVCPYLDIDDSVGDDGEFLIVGGMEYCAQNESGTCGECGAVCANCNERYDADHSGGYLESIGGLCNYCESELVRHCEDCSESYHRDEMVHLPHVSRYGRDVCDSCASDYPICEDCHEHNNDDEINITYDGCTICDSCISNYFMCEQCGALFPDDYEHIVHDSTCESCGDELDRIEQKQRLFDELPLIKRLAILCYSRVDYVVNAVLIC